MHVLTEHFEDGQPGSCLLNDPMHVHSAIVAADAGVLAAAAADSAASVPGVDRSAAVRAGPVEGRAADGPADEGVQDGDDGHRDDEEDDAGDLEEVLQQPIRSLVFYTAEG